MVFAGLLTIDTPSANLATAGVAGTGAFDPVKGVPGSDGLAVREASAGEFLSLLGMLLEDAVPPAQSPALPAATTSPATPGPAEEVSPETDFSAERSKLVYGIAGSPIPFSPAPVEIVLADQPPAAISRSAPPAGAPAPAVEEEASDALETRVSRAESGGALYQPGPDADLAFALRLSRRPVPDAGLPPLRMRDAVARQSPEPAELSAGGPEEIPNPAGERAVQEARAAPAPEPSGAVAAPATGSTDPAGVPRPPQAQSPVLADRQARPAEPAAGTPPVHSERPASAEPAALPPPADPARRAAAALTEALPADRTTEAPPLADQQTKAVPPTDRGPEAVSQTDRGPEAASMPGRRPEAVPPTGRGPEAVSQTDRRPEATPLSGRRPEVAPQTDRRPEAAPLPGRRPELVPPTDRRPEAAPLLDRRPEAALPTDQQEKAGVRTDRRPPAGPPAGVRTSPAPRQPAGPAGANLEIADRGGSDNGPAGDPDAAGEPARRRPAGVEDTGSENAGRADASRERSGAPTGGRPEAEPGREVPATVLPPSVGRADQSGAPPPAPGLKAPATGPARSEAAPEAAPGRNPGEPVRKISLQVTGPQPDRRVAVDLVDRGGRLHVAVRTPSEHLAGSLREGLPELLTRLDRSGYGAETWSPGALRVEGRESLAERAALGGGDPRQQPGTRQDPAPERNPGEGERHPPEPVWLDQVRRKRQNSVEESFLWHLQSIR